MEIYNIDFNNIDISKKKINSYNMSDKVKIGGVLESISSDTDCDTSTDANNPNNSTNTNKYEYNMFRTRYKIDPKPIGKGSFATVYRATNENNDPVAIKKIKIANLRQDRINKFMLELDISYEMKHENIVKCHEIFKTQNHWYIVLEYCNGPSFTQIIKQLQELNYKKREIAVRRFMIQLKNALHYLREKNVIHRDLKPDNILLQANNDILKDFDNPNDKSSSSYNPENYVVKLADFGFARYFDATIYNSETEVQDLGMTICGTPLYMAPEMLINYKYNIKADMWSFGIIMYEALYGYNPFVVPRLDMKMLTELIKKTRVKYDPFFSREAIDLLKKLLVVNPTNRISWEEFFDHEWFSEIIPTKINSIDHEITTSFLDKCTVSTINNIHNMITELDKKALKNRTTKTSEKIKKEDDNDVFADYNFSDFYDEIDQTVEVDNLQHTEISDEHVTSSVVYSKPIDIPNAQSWRSYSYSTSAPQPPPRMRKNNQTNPVDSIRERAKTYSGFKCKFDDDELCDDVNDFIVVTENDKIEHSEMLYNQARERRNSFQSYKSITGSVIRIVSSPINYLMKSIS